MNFSKVFLYHRLESDITQQFTLLIPKNSEFSIICLKVCKQSGNEGMGFELGDRVYSFNSL